MQDTTEKTLESMTRAELAETFAGALETACRADGSRYVRRREDLAPELEDWVRDVCYGAHDDGSVMPDDTRYSMIEECAVTLTEYEPRDWEDCIFEIADGLVPVYSHELVAWLASHGMRRYYVDNTQDEGLIGADANLDARLSAGMREEYREILEALIAAFNEGADNE